MLFVTLHMLTPFVYHVYLLCSVPSSSPGNLTVVSTGPNSLSVSWEEPPEININGILTNYSIEYHIATESNQSTFQYSTVSSLDRTTLLNNLNNFTNYSVSVAANTVVGMGPVAMKIQTTDENGMFMHIHKNTHVHTCI